MIDRLTELVGLKLSSMQLRFLSVGPRSPFEKLRGFARSNVFLLIPMAFLIGVMAGGVVTFMSEIAQLAHVVIYGIPIDVHLSANATVNPMIALAAPVLRGLLLGAMAPRRLISEKRL